MIAFREIHRISILLNLRLHTAVVRRFDRTVRTVAGSAVDCNICKGAANIHRHPVSVIRKPSRHPVPRPSLLTS